MKYKGKYYEFLVVIIVVYLYFEDLKMREVLWDVMMDEINMYLKRQGWLQLGLWQNMGWYV